MPVLRMDRYRSVVEKSMYADAPVNRNTECLNLEKGSASGKRNPLKWDKSEDIREKAQTAGMEKALPIK